MRGDERRRVRRRKETGSKRETMHAKREGSER